MAVFCTAFYFAMMQTHSQLPAILLLFAFAFSMAGMNPTAVASAGKMTTVTSMGIMLPVASSGAILMPGSSARWLRAPVLLLVWQPTSCPAWADRLCNSGVQNAGGVNLSVIASQCHLSWQERQAAGD